MLKALALAVWSLSMLNAGAASIVWDELTPNQKVGAVSASILLASVALGISMAAK